MRTKSRGVSPAVRGHRAMMASRVEPHESLDFFPTGPWITRALVEVVLARLGVRSLGRVLEPCCGAGHMAEVLCEYADEVVAYDIHDYGYGRVGDFFKIKIPRVDWIIFNGPFGDRAKPFVRRALDQFKMGLTGVASFHQLRWQESIERHALFSDYPPAAFAPFAERANVIRDRWDPAGTTATANQWIVWTAKGLRSIENPPTIIIPPGQRQALERPDDRVRFTRSPVIKSFPKKLWRVGR